jgi:hypothetical protein
VAPWSQIAQLKLCAPPQDLTLTFSGGAPKALAIEGAVHLSMDPLVSSPLTLQVRFDLRVCKPSWWFLIPLAHRSLVLWQVLDRGSHIASSLANGACLTQTASSSMSEGGQLTTYRFVAPASTQTQSRAEQSAFIPALKYRTVEALRPLPVRIQSKVQLEGGKARVMAQVNSASSATVSSYDLLVSRVLPLRRLP